MMFGLDLSNTLLLLIGIRYFGQQKPAYSQWQATISELGEVGSPLSCPVSCRLFLPVGIRLGLVATLADTTTLVGLAGCVGRGYVVAAFFPGDVGFALSGSGRQSIHNPKGAVEYIGGADWLTQLSPQLLYSVCNRGRLPAGRRSLGVDFRLAHSGL